ncbi:hypothetical protein C8R44DRAFT_856370 [Mycena epipterygia]|nr:hypothetical protein C8R44DRAFT_856370 [Mycena epipterygia]
MNAIDYQRLPTHCRYVDSPASISSPRSDGSARIYSSTQPAQDGDSMKRTAAGLVTTPGVEQASFVSKSYSDTLAVYPGMRRLLLGAPEVLMRLSYFWPWIQGFVDVQLGLSGEKKHSAQRGKRMIFGDVTHSETRVRVNFELEFLGSGGETTGILRKNVQRHPRKLVFEQGKHEIGVSGGIIAEVVERWSARTKIRVKERPGSDQSLDEPTTHK